MGAVKLANNGRPTTFGQFNNRVLFRMETIYREAVATDIARRTSGLEYGEDFTVIVDGNPAKSIRSAKLFNPEGIRLLPVGNPRRLAEAVNKALTHIKTFPFREPTGNFAASIEIRVDGKKVLDARDLRGANLVEIYSTKHYASPLERIYEGRIFLKAAQIAGAVKGIVAAAGYGAPDAYNQQVGPYGQRTAVPVVRIAASNNAALVGRSVANRSYRASRASRRRDRLRGR